MSGVPAMYRVSEILKFTQPNWAKKQAPVIQVGKPVRVQFLFHDLSPCMADGGFVFSEKLMPAKGSKWILFLNERDKNVFDTYRGEKGRISATPENVARVKSILEALRAIHDNNQ